MDPLDPRAQFEAALADQAQAREDLGALKDHPVNAEFEAALRAAWPELPKPRRGRKARVFSIPEAHTVLGDERFEAIRAPFQARMDELIAACQARIKDASERLGVLAPSVPLAEGEKAWHELAQTWESTYNSQGWSARKYACAEAEGRADEARRHGVEVRVRTGGGEDGREPAEGRAHFHVEVLVASAVDVEVLRRRPGMPLRDWLKGCWGRGVNPRVYDPFLPVGLEERLGIDYFGNDLPGHRAPQEG
jgi:hypothetical protein